MARARRAAPRRSRAVIPVVIVLAAVAVALAVWRLQAAAPSAGPAADPTGAASTGATSAPPSTAGASSATPSASAATTDSAAASAALDACRARVASGDAVVDASRTGVEHWSEHVQAQTDFNAEKISSEKMAAIFSRTRLAGPDDLKTYDAAVKAYQKNSSPCSSREDASSETNATFGACRQRLGSMGDVLEAGVAAMADWRAHQAAMYRSRHQHVDDAQGIWDRAWEAAPPHIKAFDQAATAYQDAPACSS